MNQTIEHTVTLMTIECGACGVQFALTDRFIQEHQKSHETFWCPNGHPRAWKGATEAEKLRRQLRSARATAESWRDQAETAENRRRGQKAANTRLKNRIAAGVCPCCRRNFQDLRRHIAGQHPDFAPGVEGSVDSETTGEH